MMLINILLAMYLAVGDGGSGKPVLALMSS